MNLVEVKKTDHLVAHCTSGGIVDNAISAATAFCKEFGIRSVVVVHNDRLIQVTARGVVGTQMPEPERAP